ncbi:hypothetical protein DFJ73DRAFT_904462 [Zopfochytrium polystomum]|nr:hypothetical protein DFJ73DRAFT_904462 [Zopfochytrium polystomum]
MDSSSAGAGGAGPTQPPQPAVPASAATATLPLLPASALDDGDFDAYSDLDLVRLSDELAKRSRLLHAENLLFESYLTRVSPHALRDGVVTGAGEGTAGGGGGGGGADDGAAAGTVAAAAAAGGRRDKKKKGDKAKEAEKPVLLTPEQKAEIATRELEELRDEIERQREEWGKVLDNYKAELEEVEIRVSEIKKAMYEFRRDIVQQAVNPRTGKVVAEARHADAIIEKVRLKNATLKVQKNKLHLQLKQKEEMGEVLHAIDFDQLQIENKQYLAKIEERNAELLRLKMAVGKTVQILNYHKKKLHGLTVESEALQSDIKQRRDLHAKLAAESGLVEEETRKAWAVLEYVNVKAEQHELVKKLKSWERKVLPPIGF